MIAKDAGSPGDAAEPRGSASTAPTALRIAIGAQLRQLREGRGISRGDAGEAIRGSDAKISRMELGRVGLKERDVRDLLTLYGVTDPTERDQFLALAKRANTQGWWHEFGDVTPRWFEMFIGLEQAAAVIRAYEVQFVPGLLQTPEYARSVIGLGPWDTADIDRRLALRLHRQQLLSRPGAAKLWAIVEETALRRPVAAPEVMRAQLEHLAAMAARPHITLQIVPEPFAGHPASGVPFTILRFAEPDLPDIVYLEQLTGALYLDKRRDVDHYAAALDTLSAQILTPDETVAVLQQLTDERA
jgi:transcriptional regulator with XRE-family HTH domain